MFRWKLLQYVSPNGRRVIEDWRKKKLPVGAAQADLDTFLKNLAKLEKWEPPFIEALQGARYKGLSELRWKSGRVPYRILGYQTGPKEYLMLIGCTHNQKKYDPADALETARRRRDQINKKEGSTCEFKLTTS
jgi:hypothetical protein